MAADFTNPTTLGLYINSFRRGTNSDLYTQLLGTDGYGNYSGGNKITPLCTYMNNYGYNYALFYGLDSSSTFINSSSDNTYIQGVTGFGYDILTTVMPEFHAAGVVDRAPVCSVFNPKMTARGTFTQYDGCREVHRVLEYNTDVSYTANLMFTWINFGDEEFWNFPYAGDPANGHPLNTGGGLVYVVNDPGTGYGKVYRKSGTTAFTGGITAVNRFIKIGTSWRQVVQVNSDTELTVDRPWSPTHPNYGPSAAGGLHYHLDSGGTVDYDTFLYRIGKACDYIAAYGSGENVDLYIGFPSINYQGTSPTNILRQLSRLYVAGVTRLNLTNYTRVPNWSYIDGDYADNSGPSYHRVSDDIAGDGAPRQLGHIISAESPTFNNGSCPTQDLGSSYSGYFLEGRTRTSPTAATNFRPRNGANIWYPSGTTGCNPDIFAPTVTLDPMSQTDVWQYTVGIDTTPGTLPSGVGYTALNTSDTFNEECTTDVDLDSLINFDTQIVFDQEFIRQLVTDPPVPLEITLMGTDETCSGLDGTITTTVLGGTPPYTYLWLFPTKNITVLEDNGSGDVRVTASNHFLITGDSVLIAGTGTAADGIHIVTVIAADQFDLIGIAFTINTTGTVRKRDTNQNLTGLQGGTYDLTVTDDDANTETASITLETEIQPEADVDITNAGCNGLNGEIDIINVAGGNGSYLYSVVPTGDPDNYISTTTYTNLPAGSYDVKIISGSCVYDLSPQIIASTAHTTTLTTTNCTCTTLGSIESEVIGGTANPYFHRLSQNGIQIAVLVGNPVTFINLDAGTYSVIAYDNTDCASAAVEAIITAPAPPTVIVTPVFPTCNTGLCNITLTASPVGAYVFHFGSLSATDTTTHTFNNIPTGVSYPYWIEGSPTPGCTSAIGTYTPANSPTAVTATHTVVSIIGSTLGSITQTSISGGTPPYTYSWTGPNGYTASTASIANLEAGTYTVLITSSNGCTATYTFEIVSGCTEFDVTELKVNLFKMQCCMGVLALKYVRFQRQGRNDMALCVGMDLKILSLVYDALICIENPGDSALTCDEIDNLIEQYKNICDCDCCQSYNQERVDVVWNPETDSFDIVE